MPQVVLITLEVLVIFIIIFIVVSMLMCKRGFDQAFPRADNDLSQTVTPRFEDFPDLAGEPVSFPCKGNTLNGYLFGPTDAPALVVAVHKMGGAIQDLLPVIDFLTRRGYEVLAFDCTGNHSSGGEGMNNPAQSALDLDAAMAWVRAQPRYADKPVLLYGWSWGGYAVTSILGRRHDIAGAVSVAGYNSPLQMTYEDQKAKMNPSFGANIMYPFFWIELKRRAKSAFVKAVDGINASTTPVLIVQGSEDHILPPTASIYDQRALIKNPNVEYLYRESPGQAGHLTLINSKRAVVYQQDIPELLEVNRAQVFTTRDVSTFWDSLDRRRANELDPQFTSALANFYSRALAQRN